MKAKEYRKALENALDEFRFDDVSKLVNELVPENFEEEEGQVGKVLKLLRRKRTVS